MQQTWQLTEMISFMLTIDTRVVYFEHIYTTRTRVTELGIIYKKLTGVYILAADKTNIW